MFAYDKTIDPEVVVNHCDLISWFSDFASFLGTQLICENTSFTICLHMTRQSVCPSSVHNFKDFL